MTNMNDELIRSIGDMSERQLLDVVLDTSPSSMSPGAIDAIYRRRDALRAMPKLPRIVHEQMYPGFDKFHLDPDGLMGWPFRPVLHRFTAPDPVDYHDHPWGFRRMVLLNSYEEEILHRTDYGHARWTEIPTMSQGWSFVPATRIHRITKIFGDECWTLVIPNPAKEQDWKFYRPRPDGTVESRRPEDPWPEVSLDEVYLR